MTTLKPCPIKGCDGFSKPNQLMCLRHWRRVPRALNHAVFDTYRAMHQNWAAVEAYRQARDAAIAAVEAKEAEEAGR